MKTIRIRGHKSQIVQALRSIPKELAGRRTDSQLQQVFLNHLTSAVFTKIEDDFLLKSEGNRGSDGVKWKPLSPETIAQRPISQEEYRRAAARPGERGILTAVQNRIWKGIFASTKARAIRDGYDEGRAKALAGQTAWAVIKTLGGRTKLSVFGRRRVRMLRVSDRLYKSVSAGKLVNNRYYPPSPEQVFKIDGNSVVIGSTVPYFGKQHKARPVLPTARMAAESGWLKESLAKARTGLTGQLESFLKRINPSLWRKYRRNR